MNVFIIGEAGSNHDGSLDQAMCLIKVAAEATCDAVKFQMFRADRLYPRGTSQWEQAKSLEMPIEWLPDLAVRCESLGIEFMCSAFDIESVDAIDPFVRRHKVASLEATDKSLIRHVASKGKPVIVSTGALDPTQMVDFRFGGGDGLGVPTTLMHCVTAYPCPPEEANLSVLYMDSEMGRECEGLSDHTLDPVIAPVMAVALGATTIEKHFTLSRSLPGPDHAHALEPGELREMVRCVRLAEKMLGDGTKRVQPSEERWRKWQHRDGGVRGG